MIQLIIRISFLFVGLARFENDSFLLSSFGKMPVDGIQTEVCFSISEPIAVWWICVITNVFRILIPIN